MLIVVRPRVLVACGYMCKEIAIFIQRAVNVADRCFTSLFRAMGTHVLRAFPKHL